MTGNRRKIALLAAVFLGALALAPPASANMIISLSAGTQLSNDAAAMSAFNRAIGYWNSVIADPITVYISADLSSSLDAGVLGGTSSSVQTPSYTAVRTAIVQDGIGEAAQTVTSALPTAAQFTATLPSGFTYDARTGNMLVSRANMKALGLLGANDHTADDASMVFSSTFSWDFDETDGITPGTYDFEAVVVHEIGHALGFLSYVDDLDYYIHGSTSGAVTPTPLDLFRFGATPGNFTTAARDLEPGGTAVFSDGTVTYAMSTGKYTGDGRQASHWKDDNGVSANYIGIMDPSLPSGYVPAVTAADLYALDLIGYDLVQAPEPGTFVLVGAVALFFSFRRLRC
jgi:hypothetical protein